MRRFEGLRQSPGNLGDAEPSLSGCLARFLWGPFVGGLFAAGFLLWSSDGGMSWADPILSGCTVGFLLGAAYFYVRIPLKRSGLYTNFIFLYIRRGHEGWFNEFSDRFFGFLTDQRIYGARPLSTRWVAALSTDSADGRGEDSLLVGKKHVIFSQILIPGSRPDDLKVFEVELDIENYGEPYVHRYAHDGRFIYHSGFLFDGLDCTSFEVLSPWYFRDRNGIYNIHHGKDKSRTYVFDSRDAFYQKDIRPLDIHAESFEVIRPSSAQKDAIFGRDKNRFYDKWGLACTGTDQ